MNENNQSASTRNTEQGNKAVEAGMKQSSETGESIRLLAESINEAAHRRQLKLPLPASSRWWGWIRYHWQWRILSR
jgi:hypothetical protein